MYNLNIFSFFFWSIIEVCALGIAVLFGDAQILPAWCPPVQTNKHRKKNTHCLSKHDLPSRLQLCNAIGGRCVEILVCFDSRCTRCVPSKFMSSAFLQVVRRSKYIYFKVGFFVTLYLNVQLISTKLSKQVVKTIFYQLILFHRNVPSQNSIIKNGLSFKSHTQFPFHSTLWTLSECNRLKCHCRSRQQTSQCHFTLTAGSLTPPSVLNYVLRGS